MSWVMMLVAPTTVTPKLFVYGECIPVRDAFETVDRWRVRRAALQALAQLAPKGDSRAIGVIVRHALQSLVAVAEKREQRAASAVVQLCMDPSSTVRMMALQALPRTCWPPSSRLFVTTCLLSGWWLSRPW